jgi:hypothetical protein
MPCWAIAGKVRFPGKTGQAGLRFRTSGYSQYFHPANI